MSPGPISIDSISLVLALPAKDPSTKPLAVSKIVIIIPDHLPSMVLCCVDTCGLTHSPFTFDNLSGRALLSQSPEIQVQLQFIFSFRVELQVFSTFLTV